MSSNADHAAADPAIAATSATLPRPVDEWMLSPDVDYLNHGSFGARPRVVATAQARWRNELEAHPVEFLDRRRVELIERAKAPVAALLGLRGQDFGFVTNATEAVNVVLRTLDLRPGDEILTTTHVYNAVRQSLRELARRAGCVAREIDIPVPIEGPDEVVERIEGALTSRTRLVIVDHVTSPTATVLPVARIAERCARRGVDVLVDGAHAPGMVELDVPATGAAYYAANLHKWTCAPLGTAILWVRPDRQADVHPLVVSHFYEDGLASEFSWQGTRDVTGWLAAATALEYFDALGWSEVRAYNHELVVRAADVLCERWGTARAAPADGSMTGSMATVALPAGVRRFSDPKALQRAIFDLHRIEVPVVDWGGRWWVRVSGQVYNTPDQYERLAAAVDGIVRRP